jgi:very-short-patch-repair endonuclease
MHQQKSITDLCRELRQQQTKEEDLLWRNLRNRWFKGFKFRRQHPFIYEKIQGKAHFFIADFYCAEKNLIVEIDGRYHDFQKDYDANRDAILATMGLTTIRFTNDELKDMEAVKNRISKYMQ